MNTQRYKVYIAKLKRAGTKPSCVFKVGITSSTDAMDRINYRGSNEPYPITNYFTDNKIMKAIWCEDMQEAYQLEQYLKECITGNGCEFHNWYENDRISGITEMRIWNYEEFKQCCQLMEDWQNGC